MDITPNPNPAVPPPAPPVPPPDPGPEIIEDNSLAARLARIRLALRNAATPELAPLLANFGYTPERLDEGRALLAQADDLVLQQRMAYGDQYAATQAFDQAWAAASQGYIQDLEVARVAFKGNKDAAQSLRLNGERERAFGAWHAQAAQFYQVLLVHPFLTDMARFGRTQPNLEANQALVQTAFTADAAQTVMAGKAQGLTEDRDAAVATLEAWAGDFFRIARLAVADDPQLLEMLGKVVPGPS